MALLSDLITRTQTRIRQAQGLSAQTYAQPTIVEFIQYAYDQLCLRRFWSFQRKEYWTEISDTTGMSTEDLTLPAVGLNRFIDIEHIWREDTEGTFGPGVHPIPRAPKNINPQSITMTSFMETATAGKIFRILPATAVTGVRFTYRTYIESFEEADEVPMDAQLLILSATYEYLSDDGTNTQATERALKAFTARLETLEKLEAEHEMSLHSYNQSGIFNWRDSDG